MKEFRDKTAVITGAASGIGRALAHSCVREGMKVVLADIDETNLDKFTEELATTGASVMAKRTDVAKAGEVESLAERALTKFGAVHLLFNNAGVYSGSPIWEAPLAELEWALGVNVWGVIHGVRAFIPIMLKQNTEAHIVNSASLAGLISGPGWGIYGVTKHAVVNLSESLHHDLGQRRTKIKVSVLCPGWVKTNILDSSQLPIGDLEESGISPPRGFAASFLEEYIRSSIEGGIPPEQVATAVFEALRAERFYIFTHPDWEPLVQLRADDIRQGRNPVWQVSAKTLYRCTQSSRSQR